MVITISGIAGSGKDTIAKLLAQKLKLPLIKASLRVYAKQKGIDVMDFEREYTSDSDYWDKKLDQWQKSEVKKTGNCVLASMLGAYHVPEANLKVWLYASEKIRAGRIAQRDGVPQEKALAYLRERDEFFRKKTKRIYGIDFWDQKFYDLRIDTSDLTPEEIVERIINKLKSQGKNPLKRKIAQG